MSVRSVRVKRVLRILEYVGDPEWVDMTIVKRSVRGSQVIKGPGGTENRINEAILGDVADYLTLTIQQPDVEVEVLNVRKKR